MNRQFEDIEDNYQAVIEQINRAKHEAFRLNSQINLIAVSKTQPAEKIQAIYELGHTRFGENYLQEALEKQQTLADLDIEWHFIGSIQSNKTALIAENFDWVHGVDRLKIANRLNNQRPNHLDPINIFLQVNIEEEESKSGFIASELLSSLDELKSLPNIIIRGIMAIPKAHPDTESQEAVFAKVFELNEQCRKIVPTMTHLSMGMTNDMDAAISQGATYIRVGTAIFGQRDYSTQQNQT